MPSVIHTTTACQTIQSIYILTFYGQLKLWFVAVQVRLIWITVEKPEDVIKTRTTDVPTANTWSLCPVIRLTNIYLSNFLYSQKTIIKYSWFKTCPFELRSLCTDVRQQNVLGQAWLCPYIINLLVFVWCFHNKPNCVRLMFSKIILSVLNQNLKRQIRSGFVINLEDKRPIRILIKYLTSPCKQSLPPRRWFSLTIMCRWSLMSYSGSETRVWPRQPT